MGSITLNSKPYQEISGAVLNTLRTKAPNAALMFDEVVSFLDEGLLEEAILMTYGILTLFLDEAKGELDAAQKEFIEEIQMLAETIQKWLALQVISDGPDTIRQRVDAAITRCHAKQIIKEAKNSTKH